MHYSAPHRMVVYETAEPLRFGQLKGAVPLPAGVGVPASLPNLQALSGMGELTPSPMDVYGYPWPIRQGWTPLVHQQVTAAFLALHKRCFCFNDMGTMKTLSSLWAADFLMRVYSDAGIPFKALIVAPLSTLEPVWLRALTQHFLGKRTAVVLHGAADKRRKLLGENHDFYIINPDGLCIGVPPTKRSPLDGLAKDIFARDDLRLAICDEASCYRDATTKRHRAARHLLGNRDYVWQLTGTPTPNGPVDAYGLARLAGTTNGESFTNYKARVMMQVASFKWIPRHGATEAARKMLQPAIRYPIEACQQLPPCTVQQRQVALSVEQTKALKTLKHEATMAMKDGALVHAVNEAALRMKLIQVLCGAVYDTEHDSHELNPHHRIRVLEEILEETDRKVVVFAPLTNVLNMLSRHFKETPHELLNGSTSPRDRRTILSEFGESSSGPRLLLADPGTISHGVNDLVAANILVWYGPTDKTEVYLQGNKRIDRPGQTARTTIVQLVANSLEEEIYDRLETNKSMQGLILKFAENGS